MNIAIIAIGVIAVLALCTLVSKQEEENKKFDEMLKLYKEEMALSLERFEKIMEEDEEYENAMRELSQLLESGEFSDADEETPEEFVEEVVAEAEATVAQSIEEPDDCIEEDEEAAAEFNEYVNIVHDGKIGDDDDDYNIDNCIW